MGNEGEGQREGEVGDEGDGGGKRDGEEVGEDDKGEENGDRVEVGRVDKEEGHLEEGGKRKRNERGRKVGRRGKGGVREPGEGCQTTTAYPSHAHRRGEAC